MQIIELSQRPDLLDDAVNYFWQCRGNEKNYIFYRDAIVNSLSPEKVLPKWYLMLEQDQMIGSYALLTNDIISRQDLIPWFACLFVNPEYRNRNYAGCLLEHGLKEAARKGFTDLYLSSDLEDFYERKGWTYFAEGYGVSGGSIKIYRKKTNALQ